MLNPEGQQHFGGRRIETHDGKIFCSLPDAKEYASDAIKEKYCTRFAIMVFVMEKEAETMGITMVETYGFRNDKKNINQLDLFKKTI